MLFRSTASKEFPSVVPIIDEYVKLSERASHDQIPLTYPSPRKDHRKNGGMHLFDMLRDKGLFPSNSDLSEFAGRVLPGIARRRFDKMSRGDIAARIIEHLETKDQHTREQLEVSMRDAMASGSAKGADRKSFFSAWEKIIKGIEL